MTDANEKNAPEPILYTNIYKRTTLDGWPFALYIGDASADLRTYPHIILSNVLIFFAQAGAV